MITKNTCTLIYEDKQQFETFEYTRENVKHTNLNIYTDRYYSTMANSNIQLSKMIKIRDFYKEDFNGGILKYVVINNVKYNIIKLSSVRGRYITLDLEEHNV